MTTKKHKTQNLDIPMVKRKDFKVWWREYLESHTDVLRKHLHVTRNDKGQIERIPDKRELKKQENTGSVAKKGFGTAGQKWEDNLFSSQQHENDNLKKEQRKVMEWILRHYVLPTQVILPKTLDAVSLTRRDACETKDKQQKFQNANEAYKKIVKIAAEDGKVLADEQNNGKEPTRPDFLEGMYSLVDQLTTEYMEEQNDIKMQRMGLHDARTSNANGSQ